MRAQPVHASGAFTERAQTGGKYADSCKCAAHRASPEWTAAELVDRQLTRMRAQAANL